jgi:hypothetical protein
MLHVLHAINNTEGDAKQSAHVYYYIFISTISRIRQPTGHLEIVVVDYRINNEFIFKFENLT